MGNCCGRMSSIRVTTDEIIEVLSDENGIHEVGEERGIVNMSREDCTSCNTTAILVGGLIQGDISSQKNATVDDIVRALQSRSAVVVNLKPDHWFTVVPDDHTSVRIIQSYQGLYTVSEWLCSRDGGKMRLDEFVTLLSAIVNDGSPKSAVRLFSPMEKHNKQIENDFQSRATISIIQIVGSFTWK